jgi:hypothetical protein
MIIPSNLSVLVSVEECEVLCNRLVNGKFKCLGIGSIQHLKTTFGEGFSLLIKLRPSAPASLGDKLRTLTGFVEKTFPAAGSSTHITGCSTTRYYTIRDDGDDLQTCHGWMPEHGSSILVHYIDWIQDGGK